MNKHLTCYNHIYVRGFRKIIATYWRKKINKACTLLPQIFYHLFYQIFTNLLLQCRYCYPATFKSNLGPVNPTELNRNRKQNKSFPSFCQGCNKIVKANSKRLLCIYCNNLARLKCIDTNSTKRLNSYDPQRWLCYRCYLKELPFFNTQDLSEETISITDQTIQNIFHSQNLETNRNYLSIAHLNTQSISSTFDEFQVMLYQHLFDIITLSETCLWNNTNLLKYVQMPGYSFCYNVHKTCNKIQGTTRLKQTRWNYRIYVDRVSKEEQKQKLPFRCFLTTSPWRQRKINMDSKARYDIFTYNNNLEQNHRSYWRYHYWLQKTINCTWNTKVSAWHVQLKTTLKQANSSQCQNHRSHCWQPRNWKLLVNDVLSCAAVSDYDAPYAIIKIPTASFQTRY